MKHMFKKILKWVAPKILNKPKKDIQRISLYLKLDVEDEDLKKIEVKNYNFERCKPYSLNSMHVGTYSSNLNKNWEGALILRVKGEPLLVSETIRGELFSENLDTGATNTIFKGKICFLSQKGLITYNGWSELQFNVLFKPE